MGGFFESRIYKFTLDAQLSKVEVEVILLDAKKELLMKLDPHINVLLWKPPKLCSNNAFPQRDARKVVLTGGKKCAILNRSMSKTDFLCPIVGKDGEKVCAHFLVTRFPYGFYWCILRILPQIFSICKPNVPVMQTKVFHYVISGCGTLYSNAEDGRDREYALVGIVSRPSPFG